MGVGCPSGEENFSTDIVWNCQCMVIIRSRMTCSQFHYCFSNFLEIMHPSSYVRVKN